MDGFAKTYFFTLKGVACGMACYSSFFHVNDENET